MEDVEQWNCLNESEICRYFTGSRIKRSTWCHHYVCHRLYSSSFCGGCGLYSPCWHCLYLDTHLTCNFDPNPFKLQWSGLQTLDAKALLLINQSSPNNFDISFLNSNSIVSSLDCHCFWWISQSLFRPHEILQVCLQSSNTPSLFPFNS